MDPKSQTPQVGNENLSKLENDLQKLTTEAASTQTPASTIPSTPPVEEPPVTTAQAPEVGPTVNTPPAPTMVTTPPPPTDSTKKGSPVLTVALILMAVAVFLVIAYVVGAKFFAPKQAPVAGTPVPTQTALPTVLPSASPTGSPGPLDELTAPTPTASASSSPVTTY